MKLLASVLLAPNAVQAKTEHRGCHAEEMKIWKTEMEQWKIDQKGKFETLNFQQRAYV